MDKRKGNGDDSLWRKETDENSTEEASWAPNGMNRKSSSEKTTGKDKSSKIEDACLSINGENVDVGKDIRPSSIEPAEFARAYREKTSCQTERVRHKEKCDKGMYEGYGPKNSTQNAKSCKGRTPLHKKGHGSTDGNNKDKSTTPMKKSEYTNGYNEKQKYREARKENHGGTDSGSVSESVDEMPDEPGRCRILEPPNSAQIASTTSQPGAFPSRPFGSTQTESQTSQLSISDTFQFELQRDNSKDFPSTFNVVATIVQDEEDSSVNRHESERGVPTVYPLEVTTGESIKKQRRKLFFMLSLLGCSMIGLVVALVVTQIGGKSDPIEEGVQASSTLERVYQRGSLKCGVAMEDKLLYSASVEWCKGLAAAIFGVDYDGKFEVIESQNNFESLANDEVDVITNAWVHTMEREVYLATEKTGFSFTTPLFYTGLMFGGIPPFHKCASSQNTQGNCTDLKVCVRSGTTFVDVVRDLFPEENIIVVQSSVLEIVNFLNTPTCNAIASAPIISKEVARLAGYTGTYEIDDIEFSHNPYALVTRNNDPQWSDFANWFVQAIIAAEKYGITRDRADELPTTHVFGDTFKNMFKNAIAAIGNYEEIYSGFFQPVLPRIGRNIQNNGKSGLIYSHPFGTLLQDNSPGQLEGGMLETIMERDHLNCGVVRNDTLKGHNDDFDAWKGLDVDYCHALSAAIFQDHANKTKFIYITKENAFVKLSRKDVDVIGLAPVNIENDVLEPTTGKGYSFTQPIFYDSVKGPLALATRQDENQWSSFVYWTVSSTFYAEEKNITKESSNKMPLVDLFGSHHKTMMRDIISTNGNYGEIYENNIEQLGARTGLNLINANGPQLYAYPSIESP